MLRSRVRRSFTVEVKSKSRQASSWPDNPAPSPVNWAALDPAPETPSRFEPAWSDEPMPAAPPVAAEKPRRILPSLILAEPEPEPEIAEPQVAREPRLPRVRRPKVAKGRNEAKASEATWSFADIATASDDLPPAAPQIQAQPVIPAAAPPPTPSRKFIKARSIERVLAPGERWKRRLPRSCR